MTDRQKWGTTKNFHLPYPTNNAPLHQGAATIQALAEDIDHTLLDLLARIERLEKKVKDSEKQTNDGILDASKVAKGIRKAIGLPVITVEVDHEGQVTVKAPGMDETEALLAAMEAIHASRETERVKRRLQGD